MTQDYNWQPIETLPDDRRIWVELTRPQGIALRVDPTRKPDGSLAYLTRNGEELDPANFGRWIDAREFIQED